MINPWRKIITVRKGRKVKLTSMDKSEQRNDETQTREGFSKLMAEVKQ